MADGSCEPERLTVKQKLEGRDTEDIIDMQVLRYCILSCMLHLQGSERAP